MTPPADDIVVVFFFLSAVASILWTVFYMFRPWTSTPQGKALMVKSWGNMFLLTLGFCTLTFGPDFPGRTVIRFVGMLLFTVGIWYLLWTLLSSPGSEDYPPRSWLRRRRR